jgi:hypothetical protein
MKKEYAIFCSIQFRIFSPPPFLPNEVLKKINDELYNNACKILTKKSKFKCKRMVKTCITVIEKDI